MLPLDTCSKRDMSIIANSGSESVAPFARSLWENLTSIQRRITAEKWVPTLTKRRVLLRSAAWFSLLGRSMLNIVSVVICVYRKRPKLECEWTQHIQHACSRAAALSYPTILFIWMRRFVLLSDIQWDQITSKSEPNKKSSLRTWIT